MEGAKRKEVISNEEKKSKKRGNEKPGKEADDALIEEEGIHHEDAFEDEYDEEDLELMRRAEKMNFNSDGEEEEAEEEGEEDEDDDESRVKFNENLQVYKPGDKMEEGEVLEYDSSAYDMFHQLKVVWPCLSFDIWPDRLGSGRDKYPHTMYFIGGTQADNIGTNELLVAKASSLHRTRFDDDDEGENSDDEGMDDEAEMEHKSVKHPGSVNRLKVMPQAPHYTATWSEDACVRIFDLNPLIEMLDGKNFNLKNHNPIVKTIKSHKEEGFALAWSIHKTGNLLSGDCKKFIHLTEMREGGAWADPITPYTSHTKSVEDLQWSPTEVEVFASCSSDKTIKIWDTRQKAAPGRSFVASKSDVNVISWNRLVPYLMASGDDDGSFKIWDLRSLKSAGGTCESVGHYEWHKDQITSIEWDPNDDSVLAVAGGDDQLTIWDLSVERDNETETVKHSGEEFPPQLLFIHQGQTDIKELHWHKQIPNVILSTSEDSINMFKPSITAE